MGDLLTTAMQLYTLTLILASAGVFAYLAIKAKSIGSFRFQLSSFILIWAIAEVIYEGSELGLVNIGNSAVLGLSFHFISMAAFAAFVGARSFKFLQIKPVQPKIPVKPVPFTGAMDK